MKRLLSIVLFFIFLSQGSVYCQNEGPRPCANPEVYKNSKIKEYSAGGKYFEDWISKVERLEIARAAADNNEIYAIPVVIHIIHNGEPIGEGANLSLERINEQMIIINNDYGRVTGTPGFNIHPAGVDTRIRFCLATTNPVGQPTNGIVRINGNRDSFDFINDNVTLKNLSFWDPDKYLNIWVVKFTGNQYIGYAQYPFIQPLWSDSLPFPQPVPDVQPDGVVTEYRVFGNVPSGQSGPFSSYNKGRTLTHEIGHYLGLLHTWGDGSGCSDPNGTDYCEDTPKHGEYTAGCPANRQSCIPGTFVMKENYLDYTNDVCMNIFTADQKKRMRIVMRNCIRRKTILINPVSCAFVTDTPPKIKENKKITFSLIKSSSENEFIIESPDGLTLESIVVYDYLGKEIIIPVQKSATAMILRAQNLARGIYMAKIKASDGSLLKIRFRKL